MGPSVALALNGHASDCHVVLLSTGTCQWPASNSICLRRVTAILPHQAARAITIGGVYTVADDICACGLASRQCWHRQNVPNSYARTSWQWG